jgi:chorismate synthase
VSTLRFLTAGESHGPKLSGIIEGLPAGFPIDPALINHDLQRRQQGFGRGGRMGIEKDVVSITAGVVNGLTTGAPIAIEITNLDYKSWATKMIEPMNAPRPGHADYAGAIKYDHSDLRISLERASARETAMRTAIGSLCKQILRPFGMHILGYVTQIGRIRSNVAPFTPEEFLKIYQTSLQNEFAMGEPQLLETVEEEIHAAMKGKDTLGGVFETVALGLPPGLGSYVHYDRKLDGIIAQAMMSIHAMKAVEIGDGIKNAGLLGTEVHDEFSLVGKNITRPTNRAGGLEGGVTNGMPLLVRTFMKPISTTLTPRQSIDLALKTKSPTVYERSDFCAVPRAVVVGEAMLSFVILQAFLEKVGGDSKKAMEQNFAHLHLGQVDDFALNNAPWQFKYDGV